MVSASSEFGLDGTVEINVNEEALQEIFILSDYPLISLQEILAKSCLTKQGRIANATRINSLGRGALPISPSTGIDLGGRYSDADSPRIFGKGLATRRAFNTGGKVCYYC